MRVDATCPKVFLPVEFLHCSQCVSQYLNVRHHTSQRTLPRCEVTSLHYFGRKYLTCIPPISISQGTRRHKNGNWSQPCTVPTTTENSATQHRWNCGTTQQGALDNTESTRARATVKSLPLYFCRTTIASAHEYLDKVSSDS